MKKTKLQTRFFLSYLSLVSLIVFGFSMFFYKYTSEILINRETENIIDLTSSFQTQTDEAVKTMDTVSINIGYSNLIISKLEEVFSQAEIDQADASTLAELFVAINGSDSQVDQMNIYDFSGNVFGIGYTSIIKKVDLNSLEWFEPTMSLNGYKYISLPYSSNALSKTTKKDFHYISLYRTYFNKYGKQVGIIETMQNCKTIFKDIITYGKRNSDAPKIYVFNDTGTLLYPYDSEKNLNYSYYYESKNNESDHILLKNPKTGERELIVHKSSPYAGWTYITVQPEEVILGPVGNLFNLLLWVVLILLLVVLNFSYFMSLSLTKPIKRLRNIIRKTELTTLGEMNSYSLDSSIDELEELHQAFGIMSTNLKTSMNQLIDSREQEAKSRNLALQSQMNPHFYYNSLSSIIVLAENDQSEEVVTLCRNLSSIMRYITKYTPTLVTVREEIEYVSKYLYCMKIRYQNSLDYTISIDDSIMDKKIPKLIIQPLVENALKYGGDCIPPWKISIFSKVDEHMWTIQVRDNGDGFTEDSIRHFYKKIEDIDLSRELPEMEINGMGLLNVYSRWRNFCKESYIFTIENTQDGGAAVTIGVALSDIDVE